MKLCPWIQLVVPIVSTSEVHMGIISSVQAIFHPQELQCESKIKPFSCKNPPQHLLELCKNQSYLNKTKEQHGEQERSYVTSALIQKPLHACSINWKQFIASTVLLEQELLFVSHWRSRTVFLSRKACLDPRQRGLRNTSPQITQPLTHPDPSHIEENSPPQLQISIQLPHKTVNVIPKQRY